MWQPVKKKVEVPPPKKKTMLGLYGYMYGYMSEKVPYESIQSPSSESRSL